MLMVGEQQVLLSHLPMFHSPHDMQVLLEVSLSAAGGDPLNTYRNDRKATGTKLYTWVPRPFILSGLVAAPANAFVMVGTFFRGHFERGGVAITSDAVQATDGRLLFSRRFNPSDPPATERRYLIFGSRSEPFQAHEITAPPDFDQVTGIEISTLPADWPADWDGTAVALKIEGPGLRPDAPLREGDRIRANRVDAPAAGALSITVRTEFYFETGDLAS